jgi:hypothetical protein
MSSTSNARFVDVFVRAWERTSYARAKRAASARGLTVAAYISRLVKLHEAILASSQHESLEDYGLGRVND